MFVASESVELSKGFRKEHEFCNGACTRHQDFRRTTKFMVHTTSFVDDVGKKSIVDGGVAVIVNEASRVRDTLHTCTCEVGVWQNSDK